MDGTVKMKCPSSVERADHMLFITSEVYIHCWRTILFIGFSVAAAIPHTILNNVNHSNIINECQIIPFLNGNRRLFESCESYMHSGLITRGTTRCTTPTTRCTTRCTT